MSEPRIGVEPGLPFPYRYMRWDELMGLPRIDKSKVWAINRKTKWKKEIKTIDPRHGRHDTLKFLIDYCNKKINRMALSD